jgi:hypothetical protein
MPYSPPPTPTITLSLTASGACVSEYPALASATCVFHSGRPGLRVDGDEIGVERSHVERVAEHRQAAVVAPQQTISVGDSG